MELAKIRQRKTQHKTPDNWKDRLPLVYPKSFAKPFAGYHGVLWDWIEDITEPRPPSLIVVWPRGSGKSTDAEVAAIEMGASKKRNDCWYVRETQDQADKSVENIGALL